MLLPGVDEFNWGKPYLEGTKGRKVMEAVNRETARRKGRKVVGDEYQHI